MLLWERLVRRRSQTLSLILHDATEEPALAVTQGRGRCRGTALLRSTSDMCLSDVMATSSLELVPEHADLGLVLLLHLQLILLELVDFVADKLHLRDLLGYLALDLLGRATLIFEFGSQIVEDLVQPMSGLARARGAQIWVAPMLSSVEHAAKGKNR